MITTSTLHHSVTLGEQTLTLLNNINITINQGETVAIVGASGSGKSTLLGMLAGLDTPSGGTICIGDTAITRLNEAERAKVRADNIAFVFQNFQLLGSLTALENVALPMEVHNKPNAIDVATEFLTRVGLDKRMHHYPKQLSGGEQQRVAIARAFACNAPYLFADEPTGNLDSATGTLIEDLLFELNTEHKTTLILVTHDNALAKRCDRIFTMQAGTLTENPSHTAN